jgi:thiol-disulfide isomerase/thioredoxin
MNLLTTSKEFNDLLDSDKPTLFFVFAAWCGHCKTVKPHMEKLVKTYTDCDQVQIASIDFAAGPETKKMAEALGVNSFPTWVKYTKNKGGKEIEPKDRSFDGLGKMITKHFL